VVIPEVMSSSVFVMISEPLLSQTDRPPESLGVDESLGPDGANQEAFRSGTTVKGAPRTSSGAGSKFSHRGTPDGALVRKRQSTAQGFQLRHYRPHSDFFGHWKVFQFFFGFGQQSDERHCSPGYSVESYE
jgi:hypothetical protein